MKHYGQLMFAEKESVFSMDESPDRSSNPKKPTPKTYKMESARGGAWEEMEEGKGNGANTVSWKINLKQKESKEGWKKGRKEEA